MIVIHIWFRILNPRSTLSHHPDVLLPDHLSGDLPHKKITNLIWTMLSVHGFSGEHVCRKRRCSEVEDSLSDWQQDSIFQIKKTRNDQPRSLYDTCGEQIMSEEESWSKENFDGSSGNEMMSDQESAPRTTWKIFDGNSPSTSNKISNAPIVTPPVSHRGRSISDYCTLLSAKKNTDSGLNRAVRFEGLESMMLADEPMKVDSICQGCKATATDASFLLQCNFCCRSFCSSRCVCHCEHCGGVFCHSTCSTLNYSSVFAKTLCLDCNNDVSSSCDYYQI